MRVLSFSCLQWTISFLILKMPVTFSFLIVSLDFPSPFYLEGSMELFRSHTDKIDVCFAQQVLDRHCAAL